MFYAGSFYSPNRLFRRIIANANLDTKKKKGQEKLHGDHISKFHYLINTKIIGTI